jgi:hypothetical protein
MNDDAMDDFVFCVTKKKDAKAWKKRSKDVSISYLLYLQFILTWNKRESLPILSLLLASLIPSVLWGDDYTSIWY